MSFGEGSLVWAKSEGTWFAAVIVPFGDLELEESPGDDLCCVYFFSEGSGGVLPLSDVEAFDPDDEGKNKDPAAAKSISMALGMISTSQGEGDGRVASEKELRKMEKKARKEERKLKKAQKAERKRERSVSTVSETDRDDNGNDGADLDELIQRGTSVSDNRLEVTRAKVVERNAADVFLSSASTSFVNALSRAQSWYQTASEKAKASNQVMSEHEADLLRIVDEKLRSNAASLIALRAVIKRRSLSTPFEEKIRRQIESLNGFEVEAFCEQACKVNPLPPQKPEKRKGGKFSCRDPQLVSLLDLERPLFRDTDAAVIRQLQHDVRSSLSKVGFRKPAIMRQWISGRELPVVQSHFDIQPVAAHGAVARKFSEFSKVNSAKAIGKAQKSVTLSRFISNGQFASNETLQAASFFKFHEFRDYGQATVNLEVELEDVDATGSHSELPLNFDPDATFAPDEDLAAALQAFEMNAPHSSAFSAQRSQALPSEQSMWGADSEATREEAPSASHGSVASSENVLTAGKKSSWRGRAKDIIVKRASMYVAGQKKPKCLPPHQFSEVVTELLKRAVQRKSEVEKISSLLQSRDLDMPLTPKEESSICSSVDHYIERHYYISERDSTDFRSRSTQLRTGRAGVSDPPRYE